jgi:uracil-DNA glycosylase family 4
MAALHRAGFANIPTSQHPNDGLTLRDAFIAAAVRCAPPANKPTTAEIVRCLPHLEAEINALAEVRVVVALGKIAFDAYVRAVYPRRATAATAAPTSPVRARQPRPAFAHGAVYALPDGPVLIGCYHPSRQNTNTGKLTSRMMDAVFRKVRGALEGE